MKLEAGCVFPDLDLPEHTGRNRPVGGLVWRALVWHMLDWHLAMAEGGDGKPRERLAAADAVTLARFWLVPAVLGAARSSLPLGEKMIERQTRYLDVDAARAAAERLAESRG